jgi:outer membrane protein OmpA-like peptidoglycan-associated protein
MYLTTASRRAAPGNILWGDPHVRSAGGYGEVIEAVGLGVAIFSTGQQLLTSGDFSNSTSTVNYIHERTPLNRVFQRCSSDFSLSAHHPRYGFGRQIFWYNLSFEYNGNDLRNITINPLVSRSSAMIMSKFSSSWTGQAHSPPAAPMAEVLFNLSGRWDPTGSGDVSYRGELKVKANGEVSLTVTSEKWVRVGTAPVNCALVRPLLPRPPRPETRMPIINVVLFFRPASDQIVEADERRLMTWLNALGPSIKAGIARGDSPIQVEGFASTTQPGPANVRLSRRRAERVAQLIRDSLGSGTRVNVIARGEYTARTADRVEAPGERRAVITINHLVLAASPGGLEGWRR